jgi:hypothetical protein
MTDMTDDWMNPPKREATYVASAPRYPRFLIERQRRIDHFPFTEWAVWKSYSARDERDAEIATLRTQHPAWQLRERDELFPPVAYL